MQIYNCRQSGDPLALVTGKGRWQDMRSDGTTQDLTAIPKGKSDHALIMVHGFNTDMNSLRTAWGKLEANIRAIANVANIAAVHTPGSIVPDKLDIYGFTWPSQPVPRYITAYNLCDPTAPHLLDMVRQLRGVGYQRVSILCHSMGAIVTMRMVELSEVGEIERIVIEEGDAYEVSFELDQRYGIKCAQKIKALFSYWSAGDEVLGFVARFLSLFRPGVRVGAVPLPKNVPEMYKSFNAQLIHGSEVDHGTFLNSPKLIEHAVRRLTGALGQ